MFTFKKNMNEVAIDSNDQGVCERALECITSPNAANTAPNPLPGPQFVSTDVVPDLKLPKHATSCLIICKFDLLLRSNNYLHRYWRNVWNDTR